VTPTNHTTGPSEVLVDHDVIDGAPMVRFPDDLTKYIETGKEINKTNAWHGRDLSVLPTTKNIKLTNER
jgi:hypothetical protein